MYKVLRPVDTNDATRGFWPRYQEPGPLTFLQGVRTLLGPLALLLRPPGIATNLQSLNAEKEAGGHSSFHQSVANEATDDWRGYEPGTPGSRTCFSFSTVDKLSTLAFWFHGPSRYFPLNLFFPSKGAARAAWSSQSRETAFVKTPTIASDFSPYCSTAFLPIVAIESN